MYRYPSTQIQEGQLIHIILVIEATRNKNEMYKLNDSHLLVVKRNAVISVVVCMLLPYYIAT